MVQGELRIVGALAEQQRHIGGGPHARDPQRAGGVGPPLAVPETHPTGGDIVAITVVVEIITDLVGVGVDAVIPVVTVRTVVDEPRGGFTLLDRGAGAEAVAIVIGVPAGQLVVDDAVAVIVDAVAPFDCSGEDGRVGVIAVFCDAEAVAIGIELRAGVERLEGGVFASAGDERQEGGETEN